MHDVHDALRGQKTPPPGVRPGSLVDPGPQRSDRTVRRSSGKAPLLVVASLADPSADGVDAATLSFLTASALEARRKKEEEEEQQVDQPVPDSVEWVQLSGVDGKTHFWNRRSNETAWNPPEGIKVGLGRHEGLPGGVVLLAQGLACQYVRPSSFASRVKVPPPAQGGIQILGAAPSSSTCSVEICADNFCFPGSC